MNACVSPRVLSRPCATIAAIALSAVVPLGADTLILTPTDDTHIRENSGNAGANSLVIVGDTTNPNDYLRGCFAFDLSDPLLAGATINSATLTLTADRTDGSSANQVVTIDFHELSASFTNDGATWTSRNGTDNWTNPGGDFGSVLASLDANASLVSPGDELSWSSAALASAAESASGDSLYLIGKLNVEDNSQRNAFFFESRSNATAAPTLTLDYTPAVLDPVLTQDTVNGAPDLNLGAVIGSAPISATRTVRFTNDGPTNSIEISSAAITGDLAFTLTDIAVNGTGGLALPQTLAVNDFVEFTVTATSPDSALGFTGTLAITTDALGQDQSLPIAASFFIDGAKVNTNALMEADSSAWGGGPTQVSPGLAAASNGMLRVKGNGDPDGDNPDSAYQATGIPAGFSDWQMDFHFTPIDVTNFASYVDPDESAGITGPDGGFTDRTFQWVLLGSDADPPNPDYGDTQAANTILNLAYMPDGVPGAIGAADFYLFDGVEWIPTGLGAVQGSIDVDSDGDPLNGFGNGILDPSEGDTVNAYRMIITGTGFGTPSASVAITLSGGELAAPVTVTGLTTFHTLDGTTNTPTAQGFTTADLSSDSNADEGFAPSFWVDDACYFAGSRPDPDLVVLSAPGDVTIFGTSGTASTDVLIRNDGASTTLTGTASLSGTGLSITSPTAISLAPGATQTITIEFDASAVTVNTPESATLTLATDDPLEPSLDLAFTGLATTTVDLGSGGVDFATNGLADLTGSGITAYGWIRSDNPDRVEGGHHCFFGGLDGTRDLRGFIAFDLSAFSPGDTIDSATLSLWSHGATTNDANGGIVDIEITTINVVSLPEVAGFGDGFTGGAQIVSSGLPATWTNLNSSYGAVLGSTTANLDTIACGDEVQVDLTSAIQAAITNGDPQISFGLQAPDAVTHGARNFFNMAGMTEYGSSPCDDTGPNLRVVLSGGAVANEIIITGVARNGSGDIIIDFTGAPGTTFEVRKGDDLTVSPLPSPITAQNAPVITDGTGTGQAIINAADAVSAAGFFQLVQP